MKKKLVWTVSVVLACLFVLTITGFSRPCQITKANYERIEKGMSVAEVESILGGKPNYSDAPPKAQYNSHSWHSEQGDFISIKFDENRKVYSMSYRANQGPPYGFLQKIFDRIDTILGRVDGKRDRDTFFD